MPQQSLGVSHATPREIRRAQRRAQAPMLPEETLAAIAVRSYPAIRTCSARSAAARSREGRRVAAPSAPTMRVRSPVLPLGPATGRLAEAGVGARCPGCSARARTCRGRRITGLGAIVSRSRAAASFVPRRASVPTQRTACASALSMAGPTESHQCGVRV